MVICLCWVAAFSIRFAEVFAPVTKGVPPIEPYLWLLLPIVGVLGVAFQAFHLYRPQRMGSHLAEFLDIAQAHTLAVLILFGLTFFIQQFEYSLLVILYFWILGLVLLGFSRMVFREGLRFFRRLGYNQRYVLVLGAGKLAQRVVRSLRQHGEFGLQVQGYLTHDPTKLGKIDISPPTTCVTCLRRARLLQLLAMTPTNAPSTEWIRSNLSSSERTLSHPSTRYKARLYFHEAVGTCTTEMVITDIVWYVEM